MKKNTIATMLLFGALFFMAGTNQASAQPQKGAPEPPKMHQDIRRPMPPRMEFNHVRHFGGYYTPRYYSYYPIGYSPGVYYPLGYGHFGATFHISI